MIVPVREVVLVLAATEYVTVPAPVPEVPEVRVIQPELAAAAQAQPTGAVTVIVPVSALALCVRLDGAIE